MIAAVIGAGVMGCGIAQVLLELPELEKLWLCDVTSEKALAGRNKVMKRFRRLVEKGRLTEPKMQEKIEKICCGTPEQCAGADLILEAVAEDMAAKRQVFRQVMEEGRQADGCIYATNTSSLSITEIAAGLSRPVIGMHFFNPAPLMTLMEVIPGLQTPPEWVRKVEELAVRLGKKPVRVAEAPGFAVNRLLIPMINEAVFAYSEGICDVAGIDTAMKLGCHHPLGPLELADVIGLDICLKIMETLQEETGDPKYRPAPLLRRLVRGGFLGVKTGVGFYDYRGDAKRPQKW